MGVRPIGEPVSLHVPGIYQRIKNYELTVALKPDPRLYLHDLPEDHRAALETQKFAPTALGQAEALMQGLPVTVPRWYVGGRSYREVRGWPPFDNRRVKWFVVTPDDKIMPGGDDGSGCPSERSLKRAARRAGYHYGDLSRPPDSGSSPANGFRGVSRAGLGQTCGSNRPQTVSQRPKIASDQRRADRI